MTMPTSRTVALALTLVLSASAAAQDEAKKATKAEPWRALHLLNYNTDADLELLGRQLPKLAERGLNGLILEIDYHFQFTSHPELR